MAKKEQTAVEFLLDWFKKHWNGETHMTFNEAQELAKQKEEEQIKNDYIAGMNFIPVDPNNHEKDAENYFKEKYEK